MDISPRDNELGSYPIYLRDHMRKPGPVPTRMKEQFVSDRRSINW